MSSGDQYSCIQSWTTKKRRKTFTNTPFVAVLAVSRSRLSVATATLSSSEGLEGTLSFLPNGRTSSLPTSKNRVGIRFSVDWECRLLVYRWWQREVTIWGLGRRTSRKEVKPLVTSRRRVWRQKKWRKDAFPDPQANCMHATASPPSRGRGRIRFASFSGFTVISIDEFPRKGSERARRRSSDRGRFPTCRTATATHFYWKSPRRGKIHAVQSPNSSLSKGTKSYHAVRSRRCPKSDAAKKKV